MVGVGTTGFDEFQNLNLVAKYQHLFDIEINQDGIIPADNRCQLNLSLLREEVEELSSAIESKNIVEVADALCDIQYVLSGAVHEFGLGRKFKQLMEEVHQSNMRKACASRAEAEETLQHYLQKDGTQAYILEKNGKYLVCRQSDNLPLQSPHHAPANLVEIIQNTNPTEETM